MARVSRSREVFVCSILVVLELYWYCSWCEGGKGKGSWEVLIGNAGVSAMHMALVHSNKLIIFDRSDYGPSNISLPEGKCRVDPKDKALKTDCWAHSIEYDIASNKVRPLMIETDTWCSGGAMDWNGRLIQTGGFNDGERVVRVFDPCQDCDWAEHPEGLAVRRWYASDAKLPDGRIIVMGGRRQFSYEFVPKALTHTKTIIDFDFLLDTTDSNENNLYPFLHLAPDGNLFVFANTRSLLLDYNNNRVLRHYRVMPGGVSRNYPSSGSSVLLPLDGKHGFREASVLICGGAKANALTEAIEGNFLTAAITCGSLKLTDLDPQWVMEDMPMPRVMGDMLLLPTGDVLIINGAQKGTAGWFVGRDPALYPLLYKPALELGNRFYTLSPSTIPRMYHSSCHLLPDGRVVVGGSNPNVYYNFTGVPFPTDLSLEAFSPPYFNHQFTSRRPTVTSLEGQVMRYGVHFELEFSLEEQLLIQNADLSVTLLAPSFTTHSFSMNQRLLRLQITQFAILPHTYHLSLLTPPSKNLAPPGFYLLFVVHAGIPSPGQWVQVN